MGKYSSTRRLVLISIALFFCCTTTLAQKTVLITRLSKTVPAGKKWILEAEKKFKVQISQGTLNSGSLCNALFLSSPGIIMGLNYGDLYNSKAFNIIFRGLEKIPYTNDYTYEFVPISFVDDRFSINEFRQRKPEEIGIKKIVFKAGETVFITTCLESIEMTEVNMTSLELLEEKKKKEIQTQRTSLIAKNFNIPTNPEQHVGPELTPKLKDSAVTNIVFESQAVVFRKRNQKGGYDDSRKWVLSLDQKRFKMQSGSIDDTYTVIGAKYDAELHTQEFQLTDATGLFTHKLNISYNNTLNLYIVMFSSIDNKDNYQFQEVNLKEINSATTAKIAQENAAREKEIKSKK
jgi:hypothetical protein